MPNTRNTALPLTLALGLALMLVLLASAALPGPGPQRSAGLAAAGDATLRPVDPGAASFAAGAPVRWQAGLRELTPGGTQPTGGGQLAARSGPPPAESRVPALCVRAVRLLI